MFCNNSIWSGANFNYTTSLLFDLCLSATNVSTVSGVHFAIRRRTGKGVIN